MKKITISIGFVLWFLSGHVRAEIAIIAPFSDENCDQFFDNKTLLPNPGWNDGKRTGLITLLVNIIVGKAAENSGKFSFQKINGDNPAENNLYCFQVPKVIMANNPLNQPGVFLINKEVAGFTREALVLKASRSMCCYVRYPLVRQLITT